MREEGHWGQLEGWGLQRQHPVYPQGGLSAIPTSPVQAGGEGNGLGLGALPPQIPGSSQSPPPPPRPRLSPLFQHSRPFSFLCAGPGPEMFMGRVLCVCSAVPDSLRPHGPWLARLLCPWDSPGKNTGVGCLPLLQGIFSTPGIGKNSITCVPCSGRRVLYS